MSCTALVTSVELLLVVCNAPHVLSSGVVAGGMQACVAMEARFLCRSCVVPASGAMVEARLVTGRALDVLLLVVLAVLEVIVTVLLENGIKH
jgi:hypothetical protein